MESSFITYLSGETTQIHNYLGKEYNLYINIVHIHPNSQIYLSHQESSSFKIICLYHKSYEFHLVYNLDTSKLDDIQIVFYNNFIFSDFSYDCQKSRIRHIKRNLETYEGFEKIFENIQFDLTKYIF